MFYTTTSVILGTTILWPILIQLLETLTLQLQIHIIKYIMLFQLEKTSKTWCCLTSSEVPMTIRRSASGKSVRYFRKWRGSSSPKNTMSGLTTPLQVGHFGTVPLITSGWWHMETECRFTIYWIFLRLFLKYKNKLPIEITRGKSVGCCTQWYSESDISVMRMGQMDNQKT